MTESFKQLDELGYVVLPAAIPAALVAELNRRIDQLFEQEGEHAGAEFKQEPGCRRLANLVNKGDVFQRVIADTLVLKYVTHVLANVKLSSLNVRSVDPQGQVRQPLHVDMAAIPDERGFWVCNALWMLQDITIENGPLRVVPGTHRSGQLPQDVLENPSDHSSRSGDRHWRCGNGGRHECASLAWGNGESLRQPPPGTARVLLSA